MCLIDDSDGPVIVLHSRQQRARKPHRCHECRRTIQPGEVYTDDRIVFDGSAQTVKVCPHCMAVRGYLQQHCGGWLYGGLHEDIAGHYYSSPSNDAGERRTRILALGMDRRWARASGALWPVPAEQRKDTP